MKQSLFYVAKMDCPTEEQLIRNRLKSISGIDLLNFDLMSRVLTVSHQLDDDQSILSALESLGLGAQRKDGAPSAEAVATDHHHEDASTATKFLMGVSGVAALASEGVAYASGNEQSWPVIALALLSIAAGGRDTLRKGWVAMRTLTLNINFLMSHHLHGQAQREGVHRSLGGGIVDVLVG